MELLFESATGFDGDYRVTEAYGIHPLPFDGQCKNVIATFGRLITKVIKCCLYILSVEKE
ncbi:hypothetical protein EJB05_03463 [Eragrostis curvula]|uniref:Uncharacterized protein n=1 Tax=Eragrostis curvula TaxID=38414 RepID=A0A5J9W7Y6_9POAL|nr:hypothetical protein EJB05_03463 [Eragrostis curvula]